jgi:hypothetical protein
MRMKIVYDVTRETGMDSIWVEMFKESSAGQPTLSNEKSLYNTVGEDAHGRMAEGENAKSQSQTKG